MGGNVVSTLIMVQGYIFVLHGSYHNHMYHIIKLPPFPLSIVVICTTPPFFFIQSDFLVFLEITANLERKNT